MEPPSRSPVAHAQGWSTAIYRRLQPKASESVGDYLRLVMLPSSHLARELVPAFGLCRRLTR